jgi:MYXO-CTERM domain-containing protein
MTSERYLRAAAALITGLTAATASAGITVRDDFDDPAFPPPGWTVYASSPAGVSVSRSPGAAHRGQGGLRLLDQDAVSPNNNPAYLTLQVPPGEAYFFRFWLKTSGNGVGTPVPLWFASGGSGLLGLRMTGTGTQPLFLVEVGAPAGVDVSPGRFIGNGWHLVETSLLNMGTRQGSARVMVDGEELAAFSDLDWRGWQITRVLLGEMFSTIPGFQGTLDFDDVRGGSTPLASRLRVSLDGPLRVGDCSRAEISLTDSFSGAAAPVPASLAPALEVEGPGMLFADPGCTLVATWIDLERDALSAPVYLRAHDAGEVRVTATDLDYLEGTSAPVRVQRGLAGWAYGCSSAGMGDAGSGMLVALIVGLAWVRPRRAAARCHPRAPLERHIPLRRCVSARRMPTSAAMSVATTRSCMASMGTSRS